MPLEGPLARARTDFGFPVVVAGVVVPAGLVGLRGLEETPDDEVFPATSVLVEIFTGFPEPPGATLGQPTA